MGWSTERGKIHHAIQSVKTGLFILNQNQYEKFDALVVL
jgi:hypothetical protein